MASLTRWTWVWVNSRSWWWTGRPGVLQFTGSQRVGHNWATELNWINNTTDSFLVILDWLGQNTWLLWPTEYDRSGIMPVQDLAFKRTSSSISISWRLEPPCKKSNYHKSFPGGASGKESACQCRRCWILEFHPWVGKISWRRKRQPTPVFLPGKSQGQRSLVGYSPRGRKGSDTTELTQVHTQGHLAVTKPWRMKGPDLWRKNLCALPPIINVCG